MSRYETLEVSLQTDNQNLSRLSRTVDHESEDNDESDDRVKRFRELYYRNEKLRKQLKILNNRLNDKLEKVKFPTVKKKALSVDLNHNPPSKALTRELENAYKQVKMYKKQVEILKIKEESEENYSRLKDMENMIFYKDKEIAQVQQKLKSIKNIKKMQQRKIISELQNQDVIERLNDYQTELKQLKARIKDINRKGRKRQEDYKRQQAYLVSLEKKVREVNDAEKIFAQEEKKELIMNRIISVEEFQQVKHEAHNQKKVNNDILKKIEIETKNLKHVKEINKENSEKLKEKEANAKQLQMKIMQLQRLIREEERRDREEKEPPKNKLILKSQDIDMKEEANEQSFSDPNESMPISISKGDFELKQMLREMEGAEREWKGKFRKCQHGFGSPNDKKFQFQGELLGFKVSLDQNEAICGIVCIFKTENSKREQLVQGNRSNIELQWTVDPGDQIVKISGSFTEQSYLNQLIVISRKGKSGVFGVPSTDSFTFKIKDDERVNGVYGSIRELGIDRKITELGFWIQRLAES